MLHAQKMDIRFLLVRPCNDKKKEEIVAKGHSKGIRNKKLQPAKRKDILEIRIVALVISF